MYDFYLDDILLPIPPSKMQLKIKNQNNTCTLINEGEINILKAPGLSEVSFNILIPQQEYTFAVYKSGFKNADYFLGEFKRLKKQNRPFAFKVIRMQPDGKILFNTELTVSLESYKIDEDYKDGFDLSIDVDLKEYKDYSTEIYKEKAGEITAEPQRETLNAPKTETYTVKKGDCLWNIAKKYYNNGSLYTKIAEANPSIVNPNLIYPGQVLTIPEMG